MPVDGGFDGHFDFGSRFAHLAFTPESSRPGSPWPMHASCSSPRACRRRFECGSRRCTPKAEGCSKSPTRFFLLRSMAIIRRSTSDTRAISPGCSTKRLSCRRACTRTRESARANPAACDCRSRFDAPQPRRPQRSPAALMLSTVGAAARRCRWARASHILDAQRHRIAPFRTGEPAKLSPREIRAHPCGGYHEKKRELARAREQTRSARGRQEDSQLHAPARLDRCGNGFMRTGACLGKRRHGDSRDRRTNDREPRSRGDATDLSPPTGKSNRRGWRTRPSTWQSPAYRRDSSAESVASIQSAASIHCVRHACGPRFPSSAPSTRTNSSAFAVDVHDAAGEPHRRCNAHARGFRPSTSAMKSRICAARCRWRRAISHPTRLAIRMHASSPVRIISDARSIASSQTAPRRSISHRKRKPGAVRSSCARRMRRRRSVAGPPHARDRHDAGRRSFEASSTSAIRLRSRASRPDVRPDRAGDEGPERHRRSGAFPFRPFPAKRLCNAVRGVAERERKRERALARRDQCPGEPCDRCARLFCATPPTNVLRCRSSPAHSGYESSTLSLASLKIVRSVRG